jgi:hypothetical protein
MNEEIQQPTDKKEGNTGFLCNCRKEICVSSNKKKQNKP